MGPRRTRPVVLDTGALIALERGSPRIRALLAEALRARVSITVPAGVVGQAWRDGRRQAAIATLLGDSSVRVLPLDHTHARACGVLLGQADRRDLIDASVVLHARSLGAVIATSNADDLRRLDPDALIVEV